MGKYDYIYETCKTEIEIEKSMSDDTIRYCNCGGRLRRYYGKTSCNFILKGSGYHSNDYSK